jgi:hypothetical protein
MFSQFDIFRLHHDGAPVWVEPASTLDDAQERVQQLGTSEPGEYIILNQRTGHKIPIKVAPLG